MYHICPCTNIEYDNIEMGESMDVKMLLVYVACIIGILIVGKIFIIPIKIITKLIINSFLGAVLLYVINIVGTVCGLHIGINVVTALVVGILGIPGAVLLTVLAIFIWNRAIWELRKNALSHRRPRNVWNAKKSPQKGRPYWANGRIFYSTVTDFAKFLGLSTSNPLFLEI